MENQCYRNRAMSLFYCIEWPIDVVKDKLTNIRHATKLWFTAIVLALLEKQAFIILSYVHIHSPYTARTCYHMNTCIENIVATSEARPEELESENS